MNDSDLEVQRQRRIRRNVVLLTLLALSFYVGYIVLHFAQR